MPSNPRIDTMQGYVQPEDLFRALQDVLAKYKIRFMIAPYSSLPLVRLP